jgi:hypothetical protein
MPLATRRFQLFASMLIALCLILSQGSEVRALYDVQPGEASGRPGSIIRVWPLEGGGPSGAGATAFRILYRSTGLSGER